MSNSLYKEIFQVCNSITDNSVWALEFTVEENGVPVWIVYCENKKKIKKIPKIYNGYKIKSLFCERPKFSPLV